LRRFVRGARERAIVALVRLRAYALALSLSSLLAASAAAQLEATSEPATRRIAFLLPALDAATHSQLREALLAQSAILGAEIVLLDEAHEAQAAAQRERAEAARETARDEDAALVLWLETSVEGAWVVHVLDMEQDRASVRRIETRDTPRAATIEAVAVLTREASRAVFAKREPVPQPPAEEPEPSEPPKALDPTPPAPLPAAPSPAASEPTDGVRLALGYEGTDFAPQTSFAHGLALSARLPVWRRVYAGMNVAWLAPERPKRTGVSVQRVPVSAHAGLRTSPWPAVELDLELAVTVEILQRSTSISPGPLAKLSSDGTRALVAVGPRLRAELKPWTFIGFFVGGGLDILLTRLAYEAGSESGSTTVFLQPDWIHSVIEAGVAVYP
jgi:hypothetical protein